MEIITGKFIRVPKPSKNDIANTTQEQFDKVFSNMLGQVYQIYLSEYSQEYVILAGTTEKAEKEFQESIYKSLVELGEDKDYARKVAKGEEELEGCMYFDKECFELLEEGDTNEQKI